MFPGNSRDVEDEEFYEVEEIGYKFPGWLVKDQSTLEALSERLVANGVDDFPSRFYPSPEHWQVYQQSLSPPAFVIRRDFEPLRRVIDELGLPNEEGVIYYSRFFQPRDIPERKTKKPTELDNYTFEVLGVRISRDLANAMLFKRVPYDPSKIEAITPFWWESDYVLIEIWRARFLRCPLEALDLSPSKPTSPYLPSYPFMEYRWHPERGRSYMMGGLMDSTCSAISTYLEFKRDVLELTSRKKCRGRTTGTTIYASNDEFYRVVVETYERLCTPGNPPPSMNQVAGAMRISDRTFHYYKSRIGFDWPPLRSKVR